MEIPKNGDLTNIKIQYRGSKKTTKILDPTFFSNNQPLSYKREVYLPQKVGSGRQWLSTNKIHKKGSRQNNTLSFRITIEDGVLIELCAMVQKASVEGQSKTYKQFLKTIMEMPNQMINIKYSNHLSEIEKYIKKQHKQYWIKKHGKKRKLSSLPSSMLTVLCDTLIRFKYISALVIDANYQLIKSLDTFNPFPLKGNLKQLTAKQIDKFDIFVVKYRMRIPYSVIYNIVNEAIKLQSIASEEKDKKCKRKNEMINGEINVKKNEDQINKMRKHVIIETIDYGFVTNDTFGV